MILLLIVVELVFFAPQPGDRLDETNWVDDPAVEKAQSIPEQVLKNTHLVEASGSKKLWELDSAEARKSRDSLDWTLDRVKVNFYGEKKVSYLATGLRGFVGDNQQKLEISGDTEIKSSNGYKLYSDKILYKTEGRQIEGPDPVRMIGPKEKKVNGGRLDMNADQFDANVETNWIHLKNNVKGKKKISGGREMHIRAQHAQFSGQSNSVLFEKDVVIDVDQMTITGPRARFLYQEGALYSMLVDGGVKIKDVGRWGVAGEAEVFFQEDKYVFRDSPKVVEGADQLIGDEIIIYDGGDRIQIKRAKTKYNSKNGVSSRE